jgi:proline iminopeptidase
VLVVHGGPGAGAGANDMRYFDPKHYRIILFDQRGAKRSLPFAEIKENTTRDLIEDMEKLRLHLKVNKWLLFGGSWGSALSVAYGEAHPTSCLGFVLRGVFLGTEEEIRQLWYGMQDTFPEEWQAMVQFLPENERSDLMKSYYARVINPDPTIHMPAAKAFIKYDMTAAFLLQDTDRLNKILEDEKQSFGMSKLFMHYAMNKVFLAPNHILNNLYKIKHLPAIIVHGRYDVICRAKSAYLLHTNWPGSELYFIQDAGHSAFEPGITRALINATEKMKIKLD